MRLIDIAGLIGVRGYLQPDEMEKLSELAAGRNVIEIGSFRGLSSFALALTAKSLLCVDTFAAHDNGQTQMDHATTLDDFKQATTRFTNVKFFVGTSADASSDFPGGMSFDMVFIDGMHDEVNVRLDRDLWWARLLPGGIMAFHDYQGGFPGVVKVADESFGQAKPGTVVHTLRWVIKN